MTFANLIWAMHQMHRRTVQSHQLHDAEQGGPAERIIKKKKDLICGYYFTSLVHDMKKQSDKNACSDLYAPGFWRHQRDQKQKLILLTIFNNRALALAWLCSGEAECPIEFQWRILTPLSVCCFYDKLTDAQAFVVVGRDTVDTEVSVKLRGEPFLSPLAINTGLSHHPKYLTHKRYH